MTALQEQERQRDQQDATERQVYRKLTYVDGAGSYLDTLGTDTEDSEVININLGYGCNFDEDTDTEVWVLAGGSDTNQKAALLSIPFDKQRKWPVGTGGIQHPIDADRYIEFNGDEIHLKDGKFVIGNNREITLTVSNGTARFAMSGDLVLAADNVDIQSATLTHNGVNVGDDHKHTGVDPGNGITGNPVGG